MNTVNALSVSTASPEGFTLLGQKLQPEQRIPHEREIVLQANMTTELGLREMTRQQWESLKPLIQEIYIDEDKPFQYLAKILREDYDFEPTRRQFSRQINKWEFRKNVPRSERRVILQSLPGDMREGRVHDRRLNEGKLRNWQRRYRDEVGGRATVAATSYESPSTGHETGENSHTAEPPLEPDSGHEPSIAPCGGTLYNDAGPLGATPEGHVHVDLYQESWPFDWSTIDIPGSPGLSRLFKALEIESATQISVAIPPLSLDAPETADTTCLTTVDLQKICSGIIESRGNNFDLIRSTRGQKISVPADTVSGSGGPYSWQYSEDLFYGYIPDPFQEIYVFPLSLSPSNSRNYTFSPSDLWTQLQAQATELEDKFDKMKELFLADTPAMIVLIEDLGQVLYQVEKYKKAECHARDLARMYEATLGANHVKTLTARQRVVETLTAQGHLYECRQLNDKQYAVTSTWAHPHDPLAMRVLRSKAWLEEAFGRIEESEKLRREILQINLTTYGPRHADTMMSLSLLGHNLCKRKQEEGQLLLQTALQISIDEPSIKEEATCWVALNLSSSLLNLNRRESSEKSYNIATMAVERYSPLLGAKMKQILQLEQRRAWTMFARGQLNESETLFRYLVSLYATEKVEANRREFANACDGLADVLRAMGQLDEATRWYEEAFQIRLSSEEAMQSATLSTCRKLAQCYQSDGRLGDALYVYSQMIEKSCNPGRDASTTIAGLELNIIRIQQNMEPGCGYIYQNLDWNFGEKGEDEERRDRMSTCAGLDLSRDRRRY